MRILVISPPWLPVPPPSYGGIELIVKQQVDAMVALGHDVHLVTVGSSQTNAQQHALFAEGMFEHLTMPSKETVAAQHMSFALDVAVGGFDLIHDHTGMFSSLPLLRRRSSGLPPALHTLHNGVDDPELLWSSYDDRLWFNCISEAQLRLAPRGVKPYVAGVVHNGVDLAALPLVEQKSDYFMTLARFCRDKGQHLAARICRNRQGPRLIMAGNVARLHSWKEYQEVVRNPGDPLWENDDFLYFHREVVPYIGRGVDYVGCIGDSEKRELLGRARALLFPIDWEEPFGLAVVEALAMGTPVVAMARGAVPELIEHGRTGFLARNEREFARYMDRVDQIDPRECRRSVAERFSIEAVVRAYLECYEEILEDQVGAAREPRLAASASGR